MSHLCIVTPYLLWFHGNEVLRFKGCTYIGNCRRYVLTGWAPTRNITPLSALQAKQPIQWDSVVPGNIIALFSRILPVSYWWLAGGVVCRGAEATQRGFYRRHQTVKKNGRIRHTFLWEQGRRWRNNMMLPMVNGCQEKSMVGGCNFLADRPGR